MFGSKTLESCSNTCWKNKQPSCRTIFACFSRILAWYLSKFSACLDGGDYVVLLPSLKLWVRIWNLHLKTRCSRFCFGCWSLIESVAESCFPSWIAWVAWKSSNNCILTLCFLSNSTMAQTIGKINQIDPSNFFSLCNQVTTCFNFYMGCSPSFKCLGLIQFHAHPHFMWLFLD